MQGEKDFLVYRPHGQTRGASLSAFKNLSTSSNLSLSEPPIWLSANSNFVKRGLTHKMVELKKLGILHFRKGIILSWLKFFLIFCDKLKCNGQENCLTAVAFWGYLSNGEIWDRGKGETGGGEKDLQAAVNSFRCRRFHRLSMKGKSFCLVVWYGEGEGSHR